MTFYNKKLTKTRFFEIAMAINYKININKKLSHIRKILKQHGKPASALWSTHRA